MTTKTFNYNEGIPENVRFPALGERVTIVDEKTEYLAIVASITSDSIDKSLGTWVIPVLTEVKFRQIEGHKTWIAVRTSEPSVQLKATWAWK